MGCKHFVSNGEKEMLCENYSCTKYGWCAESDTMYDEGGQSKYDGKRVIRKLRIFTDGACSGNPGPGGWAFVVNREEGYDVDGGRCSDTTNNRMEMKAAYEALRVCSNDGRYTGYNYIEIHSDSSLVVQAIERGWLAFWRANGWRKGSGDEVKNIDIWKEIEGEIGKLKNSGKNITFVKVKGHSNNTFNCIADERAVEEAQKAKSESRK